MLILFCFSIKRFLWSRDGGGGGGQCVCVCVYMCARVCIIVYKLDCFITKSVIFYPENILFSLFIVDL